MSWISVKDRLPDKSVDVLLWDKMFSRADYIKGGKHDPRDWDADYTHWMPLPEPPKEDNHEKR